jgi:hypothetical protein
LAWDSPARASCAFSIVAMREYYGEIVLKDSSCGSAGSLRASGSYIFQGILR